MLVRQSIKLTAQNDASVELPTLTSCMGLFDNRWVIDTYGVDDQEFVLLDKVLGFVNNEIEIELNQDQRNFINRAYPHRFMYTTTHICEMIIRDHDPILVGRGGWLNGFYDLIPYQIDTSDGKAIVEPKWVLNKGRLYRFVANKRFSKRISVLDAILFYKDLNERTKYRDSLWELSWVKRYGIVELYKAIDAFEVDAFEVSENENKDGVNVIDDVWEMLDLYR